MVYFSKRKMQKTLKWSPAHPTKKPDNIISSRARETGDTGFKPSYLSDAKEDMRFIMSNEYMRIWFKERGKHEKDTYSREQIIREESKIKRRSVQRMMTYKRPDKNEFLEEIVQTKTTKKDEKKVLPVDYKKLKYKPACPKPKMVEAKNDQKGEGRPNNDNSHSRSNKDRRETKYKQPGQDETIIMVCSPRPCPGSNNKTP